MSERTQTELSQFLSEFNKESDRGSVLIAASILDEWLCDIIQAHLMNDKVAKSLLKGATAPLSSFAARTGLAYALGLIMEHEYNELTTLRSIRNEFGHSWNGVSFETPKIQNKIEQLPWLGPDDVPNTPKTKFIFFVAILLADLIHRKQLVERDKVLPKVWGHTARNTVIGKTSNS
ncbi:MltR family transcriptional regulator [Pantoea vagans]|uniref:MltR family transcriptional regulator n=1 Tax=Pantoea vagans TaxID=470934 RepID=UPI00224F742B|nr:MltR family transcriptional regulator [Pantoea vagans]MCX3308328.1 MltR family transcriptional regulator [Pantoea vagans]